MVHAIIQLKCKNGHILPIGYDDNKCGCHNEGNACIIVGCHECIKEFIKDNKYEPTQMIKIPITKEGEVLIENLTI